jgi:Family of unknown function (DUF6528)
MAGRRTALARLAGMVLLYSVILAGSAWAGDQGDSAQPIVLTEQASDQILVLDSDPAAWESATIRWRWRPSEANGLGHLTHAWGAPSDAKLRHRGDQAYLLTSDSLGLAAVVPYPQGTGAYWAVDVTRQSNAHSIELLPDGNVAVAASRGGWVRVYTASQGAGSTTYAEFPLVDGHGVYWDDARKLLWALGGSQLVALRVGGTPAAPVLTQVRTADLPTPDGHDLQPVARDPDRLWVSTDQEVYQYSIRRSAFLQDYPGAGRISQPTVKAVGDERASGQVLVSAIQPGNICTWCTDTVNLYRGEQNFLLHGTQIYKARWWVDPNHD